MKVYKPINNNIVSALDDSDREVVIIGKGIGFKAREGAEIPKEKIDKIFFMTSQNNIDRLKDLFASLPTAYIEITDEIISYAKQHLKKQLNEGAYFTLADHINFSVMRMKQGMNFQNILLTEVRRFYSAEFEIGLFAISLIKEKLGITMPMDEAASIALHILNAEYDISISDAFHATQLLNHIVELVTNQIGLPIDSVNYYSDRFINHLKFLSQRIILNESLASEDDGLYDLLSKKYPKETQCAEMVASEIQKQHQYNLPKEEVSSLIIYIKRICAQNN